MFTILSIIFNLISLLFYNIASFVRRKRSMVACFGLSSVFCTLCNLMKFAMSGVACGLADVIRNGYWFFTGREGIVYVFSAIKIVLLYFGYEGIITIMFMVVEVITAIVVCRGTAQQLRCVSFFGEVLWMIYDWFYVGIIVSFITGTGVVSMGMSVLRNRGKGDTSCKGNNA